MARETVVGLGRECPRKQTLGNVRLRDGVTDQIILVPEPSADPNDPLNWPQAYKHWIATLICVGMAMCNFLAAGPSISIVSTTLDFFPGANPETDLPAFVDAIAKVAYFYTTTALLQGVGNFVWVPLANKYGRRPVYIASYSIYLFCAVWLIFEKSFAGFLAGRIIMGFGAGAAETIAPITISDIFFLHERGTMMALYTSFLSVGVGFGIVISGLITISHSWRVIYEVAAALIALVLLASFLAFPETAYHRDPGAGCRAGSGPSTVNSGVSVEKTTDQTGCHSVDRVTRTADSHKTQLESGLPLRKQSYLHSLRILSGTKTDESLLKMFFRPLGLILLPPVLWSALVQAVTVGFLVAVTSNVALAYESAYGFQRYQVGLCFIASILGSLIGIFAGGHFSDWVADFLTRRNSGVREPEMRLPAMALSLVSAPLALILYGVGIEYQLHWICPTVGLGLLNFSISQGTNVCLVYVIDAYRPIAGEVTLAVMGFKSLFGFLLSFYTNVWVNESGYLNAFGAMAGIAAFPILMSWPLYVWGKAIRHASWEWPVVSYVHWNADREVGE